jgi:hypothetical protein
VEVARRSGRASLNLSSSRRRKTQKLERIRSWPSSPKLVGLGCADPAVDCEVADPATGDVLTIAEACWPEGLQPGQGDPVVLELDPAEADIERRKELGYEVFTSIDSLRGYVHRRNQEAAGSVSE